MIRFIGDIHGNIEAYEKIIHGADVSVQVGDFGVGFVDVPVYSQNHRFIRGNHDNPELCKKIPNWIPDGTFENGVLYIGGAQSIDAKWRTPGVSWWPDEEISLFVLESIVDKAIALSHPHTIISHDAPYGVIEKLFPGIVPEGSQTQNGLEYIRQECKSVNTWIFGHYHISVDEVIDGIRFVCLGINEHLDL